MDGRQEQCKFGAADLVVDRDGEWCIITIATPTICAPAMRTVRFNSLEEIEGAYGAQVTLKTQTPEALDFAAALKFAGILIAKNRERKRK